MRGINGGCSKMKHRKVLLQLQKNVTGTLNLNLRLFSLDPFYNVIFILWDMEKKSHKIKQKLGFKCSRRFRHPLFYQQNLKENNTTKCSKALGGCAGCVDQS